MANKKSFIKWIMLGLAVLTNGITIAYSALPADLTNSWTSSIANFFTRIVNNATKKEVTVIPMEKLNVFLSPKENYVYNDILGYKNNEIPLGSAKQIEYSFAPEDTTDSSVRFYTEDADKITLSQSGNTVSVVGMGVGKATVYAENKSSHLVSSCEVVVTKVVEPFSFDTSIASNDICINEQGTILIDVDGGVLGHGELVNSRYYDNRELEYISSDEEIFTIDNYGVIHPISTGTAEVTVKNKAGCVRAKEINIIPGGVKPVYTSLAISGSDVCYENDMIKDQNDNKHHYQLTISDEGEELNPEDFIWESSNDLLVRVDRHGVVRGFRKSTKEDEWATITATSKITGDCATFDISVKEQLPSSMYYSVNVGENTSWNPTDFVACVGDTITVSIGYDVSVSNKQMNVTSSDENVITVTNQGDKIIIYVNSVGNVTINFSSVINGELKGTINFELIQAGAISSDEIKNVGKNIRKTAGHAMMFAIAQAFTLITIIMFLKKKSLWVCASFSLFFGFVMSSISELIQHFVPSRQGNLIDILIDFSGVAIGALIVIVIIVIHNIMKNKRIEHLIQEEKK